VNQEITDALLKASQNVTLDMLDSLSYTDQVIMEVQRLYAGHAVPFSWGKVSQEFSHRNRKGSSIIILD
jgi:hypothetical protein